MSMLEYDDVDKEQTKKLSKVDELIIKLRQAVERQSICIDALYNVTTIVTVNRPKQPSMMKELVTEDSLDSELVTVLKDLLLGFEDNTTKIASLSNRIEL